MYTPTIHASAMASTPTFSVVTQLTIMADAQGNDGNQREVHAVSSRVSG